MAGVLTELDVLSTLPGHSFRGIPFPVTSRNVRHAHKRVQHDAQYSGGRLVEITGSDNWLFRYRVPFRQGVARGGYKDLFAKTMSEFLEAYLNKERGTLVDCVHGPVQVKPGEWTEEMDMRRRDGQDVDVLFETDPDLEDEKETEISTLAGAISAAGELDAEVEKVMLEHPQEDSPDPAGDPLAQIAGIGSQLNRQRDQVSAQFAKTSHNCEKINDQLDELEDPKNTAEPARQARRLRVTTHKLAERTSDPVRVVRRHTVNASKTVIALAKEVGMTLEDLLKANPGLKTLTVVPANTVINVFRKPKKPRG